MDYNSSTLRGSTGCARVKCFSIVILLALIGLAGFVIPAPSAQAMVQCSAGDVLCRQAVVYQNGEFASVFDGELLTETGFGVGHWGFSVYKSGQEQFVPKWMRIHVTSGSGPLTVDYGQTTCCWTANLVNNIQLTPGWVTFSVPNMPVTVLRFSVPAQAQAVYVSTIEVFTTDTLPPPPGLYTATATPTNTSTDTPIPTATNTPTSTATSTPTPTCPPGTPTTTQGDDQFTMDLDTTCDVTAHMSISRYYGPVDANGVILDSALVLFQRVSCARHDNVGYYWHESTYVCTSTHC